MELVLIIALVFGTLGWFSTHKAITALFWTLLGGIGLVSGYWSFQATAVSGYDGLGYVFLLVLCSAPAGVALLLGAGIGLLTREKQTGGTGMGAIPS